MLFLFAFTYHFWELPFFQMCNTAQLLIRIAMMLMPGIQSLVLFAPKVRPCIQQINRFSNQSTGWRVRNKHHWLSEKKDNKHSWCSTPCVEWEKIDNRQADHALGKADALPSCCSLELVAAVTDTRDVFSSIFLHRL